MKYRVYSVYDSKAEAYLPPMFLQARGVALRMFSAAIADEKHDFCKFAADYTLFELGEFNDSDACFTLHPSPVSLGNALEFKSQTTSG